MDVTDIYTPVGCNECYNGYKGRVALHEVLVIDDTIRDAITNNVRKDELRKLVYGTGTITILEDGLLKVIEGLTSFEEILTVIDIDNDFGDEQVAIKDALIGRNNVSSEEQVEDTITKNELNEDILKDDPNIINANTTEVETLDSIEVL